VAGLRVQDPSASEPVDAGSVGRIDDETVICRCERVKAGEIREAIRGGVRDLNQLKSLRCGMGACGGKTCESLLLGLFREEGIDPRDVIGFAKRPLVSEVTLGLLSGEPPDGDKE
jgi:bacterioferritin-associated ferredoxin